MIESLDLTAETREVLLNAGIKDTDELYRKSKDDLEAISRSRSYHFLDELADVMEGMGYNMKGMDWVWRFNH